MKKLALTIIISVAGIALSAEEYTIQTISALKENSITPAFEKKVHKSALPVTKKKEGACNVVTVGRYDDAKKARADLAKVKAVAKDAFVRPMNRSVPAACALSAKKEEKTSAPQTPVASAPSAKPEAAAENSKKAVEAETPKTTVAEAVQPAAAVEAEPKAAEPEEKKAVSTTHVIIYDRNLARKSDITEAIEYYKSSPYYSFRPVSLSNNR